MAAGEFDAGHWVAMFDSVARLIYRLFSRIAASFPIDSSQLGVLSFPVSARENCRERHKIALSDSSIIRFIFLLFGH